MLQQWFVSGAWRKSDVVSQAERVEVADMLEQESSLILKTTVCVPTSVHYFFSLSASFSNFHILHTTSHP
jgi:hypothetical protein